MMNRIIGIFSSMKFMAFLLLVFAFAIGYATFIENDFGRSTSKALIYNTLWFELILVLLTYNLVINLVRYKLFQFKKIAVLTFHLSWIFILIGAGITRYISYEGMMHIREGESTDLFLSDDTFLQVHINDNQHQYNYDKKLFLSSITNNKFNINANFKQNKINIKYVDFLANVKDSLFENIKGGKNTLHLVVPGDNGMQNIYLSDKESKIIKSNLFSYNNFIEGAINFTDSSNVIFCNSPYQVSTMSMISGENQVYQSLSNFSFNKKTLHTSNGLNFVLKNVLNSALKIPISTSNVMTDGSRDALIINVKINNKEKEVVLYGGKGFLGETQSFSLDNLNFKLVYGSKHYKTPFKIALRDFQLERYPGSQSPSSYASEVSILENSDTIGIPYRIYMNNVLNYKGFRLFQSSYDEDEKGTILSVNHDWWGTLISYIGYSLLGLGFIFVFFSRNTRYHYLTSKLKNMIKTTSLFVLLFFLNISSLSANDTIPVKHTNRFDYLIVQDNGGRLKPVSTLTSEYLRKIYGKVSIGNLTSTQVILGMMIDPVDWSKKDLIKVKHHNIRNILSLKSSSERSVRVSFNNFFGENGEYLLLDHVDKAYAKQPKDRSKFDLEVIKIDEKINICFTIFSGGIFRFFPLPNDTNNTWFPYTKNTLFKGNDSLFVVNIMPMYFSSLHDGLKNNNWSVSDTVVSYISKFQVRHGSSVMPDKYKIKLEVLYNKFRIFSRLFIFYCLTGLLLIGCGILLLFYQNKFLFLLTRFLKWLIFTGFYIHLSGLIVRWIISGHAPWSNGYESMVYIAFVTVLSGLIFSRKSVLTLGATAFVASLLLMVAHLNWLDPSITNLVPVLNSYWLMIHVAIITASYGFFSLGSILGILSLFLISFTNLSNKNKLKHKIKELSIINEKSLEIGLFMLAIGTFLGGVWANESWGRYWGWDPKETWAFVSILIYTFVLHIRLIPKLSSVFLFNVLSMFAIWTIIMTYFGVNYYLSGLHSYAAGDPMPIPVFVYYLFALMIILFITSRYKTKKYYQ